MQNPQIQKYMQVQKNKLKMEKTMSNLNFSVEYTGSLIVKVCVPGSKNDKPVILPKIAKMASSLHRDELKALIREFPEDSAVIKMIYIVLACYDSREVIGDMRWGKPNGHAINIEIK
jgi:hypothetical protein